MASADRGSQVPTRSGGAVNLERLTMSSACADDAVVCPPKGRPNQTYRESLPRSSMLSQAKGWPVGIGRSGTISHRIRGSEEELELAMFKRDARPPRRQTVQRRGTTSSQHCGQRDEPTIRERRTDALIYATLVLAAVVAILSSLQHPREFVLQAASLMLAASASELAVAAGACGDVRYLEVPP
jgi:hypothetical protein